MIGFGLKKFAAENGLRVDAGVGYGVLRGYQATLSEGSGYKQMVITTRFPDHEKLNEMLNQMNAVDFQRTYRVRQLNFAPDGVVIVFLDNPGTLKKISAFIDWFFPLLEVGGAESADFCPCCNLSLGGSGVWKKVGGVARCYHSACANRVAQEIEISNENQRAECDGSYASGAVGALLGALLGAVVWGILIMVGYILSLVGLLIGFLAEKGYNLMRGKQGKVKIAILILAVIIGVTVGTGFGVVMSLVEDINSGELGDMGFTVKDLPMMLEILAQDSEYMSSLLSDYLLGLAFAFLGAFALIARAGQSVSSKKMIDLK